MTTTPRPAVPSAVRGSTRPRTRRRAALVLALPLLLVLAACGGDGAGAGAAATEAVAPGAAGEPAVADATTGEPMTEAMTEPMAEAAASTEPMAPAGPMTSAEAMPAEPSVSAEAAGDAAADATDVPEVLDFEAATVDGGTFEGASLAGQPTLLWFWAPWCTVCAREAPEIAELAAEYEGRARVVGVAGLSGDAAAMAAFVERGGLDDLVHVADLDGSVYTRFGVASQYDSVVLGADGEPTLLTGPVPVDRLRAELDALVG